MTTDQPDNFNKRPTPPPLIDELPEDDAPKPVAKRLPKKERAPITASGVHYPELDTALRHANLLRVRGDLAGAERDTRRALEIDPASSMAHEMLGDILALNGQHPEALESFRDAEAYGGGPSTEAKIARALIAMSKEKSAETGAVPFQGNKAVAVIASLIIPGLGLALAGRMVAAAISFIGWMVTLGLMMASPSARSALTSFGGLTGPVPSPGTQAWLVILGIANIGFYIYSLIETARVAKPANKDGLDD